MRIAIDLRGLNFKYNSGVNTHTLHLLNQLYYLKKSRSDIEIISIGLKHERIEELSTEFEFIAKLFNKHLSLAQYLKFSEKIPNKYLNLYLNTKVRFKKNLKNSKLTFFDIIILPQPRILEINNKSKLVTVFHDLYSLISPNSYNWKQRFLDNRFNYSVLAKSSKEIVSVSLSTANDIKDKLEADPKKIKLVYPGYPDIENLKNQSANQTKIQSFKIPEDYILSLSACEPRKNWINLVLAHKYLQQKYPQKYSTKLVLAGYLLDKKYYKQIIEIIKSQDIKNVVWVFDIDQNLKNKLLSKCKFLVIPSFYEGFGFPALESLKHNKPLIVSKYSSLAEIAGDSAMYINPLNYMEIARCIFALLNDEEFYNQLKEITYKNYIKFKWEESYNYLNKLILNNK